METRPITADELPAFHQNFRQTLGFPPPSEADLERDARSWDLSRTLATFDDGQIVGTAHSHLFDFALPGGRSVAAAGVTGVATRTTHRRRGIVSGLMRRQLREASERGEPVAILVASEGAIYRRFGYGIGSWAIDIEVDPRETRGISAPASDGRVCVVDEATADDLLPDIHERARRETPGGIARPKYFWESITAERKAGAQTHIVYESASGSREGYVRYQIDSKWEAGLPQHRLNAQEFVTCTNEASAALWRHLLSADLIRFVDVWNRPVDEPLRWWLVNPRAMRVKGVRDHLWVRPLDVAALLGSRRYATDVDLVIEVADDFGDHTTGRYALCGGPETAECSRTDRAADLELHVSDLGSMLLGGVSALELVSAGRLLERSSGAALSADFAFRWSPQPWSNQYF
ncbi:MAG: GNAT family N-acetyltransferase [Actinomycetota bacterium]